MTSRLILFALSLGLLSAVARPPDDLQQKLNDWVKGQPGGVSAVWVDQDGAVFFNAGHLDSAASPAPTADTFYEIGSITKVFTAVMLAESERQGKVSLQDPAAKFLLPAKDAAQESLQKITLVSLATHQSGLPRLPGNLANNLGSNLDPYADYTRGDLLAALRTHGRTAEVGRFIQYSNFGFAVLGTALASAWGETYDDALRTHILTPLGMKGSKLGMLGKPSPSPMAPGLSQGKPVTEWKFLAMAPAGALRSSTQEMALFAKAALQLDDSPLREAFERSFEVQAPHPDMGGSIGLAWMLFTHGSDSFAWHNGATAGHRAAIVLNRTKKSGLVVLTNISNAPEKAAFDILGAAPPPPQTTVATPGDYVGVYPLSAAFAVTVTEQDGSLAAQGTGQGKFLLRPVAEDKFAAVGVAAEMVFERDTDKKVTALVLHQNGAQLRGARQALPPPPKETTLPAALLAEYPGEYPASLTYVFRLTLEGGVLFIQAAGQPKIPLTPSAKDEFFSKVVDVRIAFSRDAAGKVDGFVLHQGTAVLKANRTAQ